MINFKELDQLVDSSDPYGFSSNSQILTLSPQGVLNKNVIYFKNNRSDIYSISINSTGKVISTETSQCGDLTEVVGNVVASLNDL